MLKGYGMVRDLCAELQAFMQEHGFTSIDDFKGGSPMRYVWWRLVCAGPHAASAVRGGWPSLPLFLHWGPPLVLCPHGGKQTPPLPRAHTQKNSTPPPPRLHLLDETQPTSDSPHLRRGAAILHHAPRAGADAARGDCCKESRACGAGQGRRLVGRRFCQGGRLHGGQLMTCLFPVMSV